MSGRRVLLVMSLAAVSLLTACGGSSSSSSRSTPPATSTTSGAASATTATATSTATTTAPAPPGPEGIPLEQGRELAPASTTTPGGAVDGIQCAPVEQLVYHIHSHLQVYDHGQPRTLPAGIGLIEPVAEQTAYGPFYGATHCYYWLHTHATDGIIHIESPSVRVYTLGDFFDEWRQPLSGTQVAGVKGKVTAFLNGKPWTKDPRAIPLLPHASIQLNVGSPQVPPHVVSFAGTNL